MLTSMARRMLAEQQSCQLLSSHAIKVRMIHCNHHIAMLSWFQNQMRFRAGMNPALDKERQKHMTNNEAFTAGVKATINGNKEHGWGVEDSVNVIGDILANETGADKKDLEPLLALIKPLINPSAFRQVLESKKILNESKGKKRNSALNDLLKF
jgi:hypothetical protein